LQRAAARTGAYEIGWGVSNPETAQVTPKIVWLLGADEIDAADIPKDAFVIYQGSHGDKGAQLADVILPGATYTEKSGTYVNTEGRTQMARAATGVYGAAREDWKILRAVSEALNVTLPYDDIEMLRDRMNEISPALSAYDVAEPTSQEIAALSKVQLVEANHGAKITGTALKKPIADFFFTNAISRSSPTMARCSASKAQGNAKTNFMAPGEPNPQVHYGPNAVASA
ncbi:NADH-quinone oxidoreductase, partial [Aureobasidium melanogenum]